MNILRTSGLIAIVGAVTLMICGTSKLIDERELLLTQKPWNFNAKLEGRVNDGQWKILHSETKKCDKDDVLLFGIHNTYEVNYGKYKCDDQKISTRSVTWLITAKGKLLMDNYSLTINILNEDTLQVTRHSGQYQDRYTYLHK
jgi:hypothetical protein